MDVYHGPQENGSNSELPSLPTLTRAYHGLWARGSQRHFSFGATSDTNSQFLGFSPSIINLSGPEAGARLQGPTVLAVMVSRGGLCS